MELRENRRSIARGHLEELQDLNSKFPHPKPSEIEWVKKEQKAIQDAMDSKKNTSILGRLENLVGSRELSTINLKTALDDLILRYEEILKQGTPLSREMLLWTIVSWQRTNQHLFVGAIEVLIQEGSLELDDSLHSRFMFLSTDFPWMMQFHTGRDILQYIVMPYLKGSITQ